MTVIAGSPGTEGTRSRWGIRWSPGGWFDRWGYLAVFVVVGTALYVARRPQALTSAEFRLEDGQTFFIGAFFGSPIESVLRPYAGYLHVLPRLVALLERAVPIAMAPLVANAAAVVVAVGVAGYIASGRLSAAIPNRALRLALGALVLLVPGVGEIHGSITFSIWYLGVFLVAAAVASEPVTLRGRAAELAALVVAGLTGPAVLLFAPVHVVGALYRRTRWRTATAIATCATAAVQLILLVVSVRAHAGGGPVSRAAVVAVLRGLVEPILGARITGDLVEVRLLALAVAAAILIGLAIVAWRLDRRWLAALGYLWLISVAASLVASTNRYASLLEPLVGQRYFFFPGLVVGAAILVGLAHRRGPVEVVLAIALGVGVISDYQLPPLPTYDWATRSQCIGGPEPCRVPVETPATWTIHWPGPNGPYRQVRHFDPLCVPPVGVGCR